MSGLVVRRAERCDVDAVVALAAGRPFAAAWNRAALAAELGREDSFFLVAEGLAGYALARLLGDELRLLDLAVAEEGRGTGRTLWSALLAAALQRGATRLTLEVSSANARAAAFYEKAGARIVGRRKKFYHDGSDAVLMDLDLV